MDGHTRDRVINAVVLSLTIVVSVALAVLGVLFNRDTGLSGRGFGTGSVLVWVGYVNWRWRRTKHQGPAPSDGGSRDEAVTDEKR